MQIILLDDHALFREATAILLQRLEDEVTVLDAATAKEALSMLVHYQDVDLLILDLGLPDLSGFEAIPEFRRAAPGTPILVLSATEGESTVRKLMNLGISGYVSKSANSHELLSAVRVVLSGGVYIPPRYLGDNSIGEPTELVEHPVNSLLTRRQRDVLKLIADGKSNKLIARALHISEATVKMHVSALLRLLDASNRTEAVNIAMRRGLIVREFN